MKIFILVNWFCIIIDIYNIDIERVFLMENIYVYIMF